MLMFLTTIEAELSENNRYKDNILESEVLTQSSST